MINDVFPTRRKKKKVELIRFNENNKRSFLFSHHFVRREKLIWIYEVDLRFVLKTLGLMFKTIRKNRKKKKKRIWESEKKRNNWWKMLTMKFSRELIVLRERSLTCELRIELFLVKDFFFFFFSLALFELGWTDFHKHNQKLFRLATKNENV